MAQGNMSPNQARCIGKERTIQGKVVFPLNHASPLSKGLLTDHFLITC